MSFLSDWHASSPVAVGLFGVMFIWEDFRFYDEKYPTEEDLLKGVGKRGLFFCSVDPSLGRAGRGHDDSAIISLLYDPRTRVFYVVDAQIGRRRPHDLIRDIIEVARKREPSVFAVEANQFQHFLAEELTRQLTYTDVIANEIDITQTQDKIGRIQRLQPMMASGKIRFTRRHVKLLEQLRQFPMAAHDDGPDALELAIRGYEDGFMPLLITGESCDYYNATGDWYTPEDRAATKREILRDRAIYRQELEQAERERARFNDDEDEEDEDDDDWAKDDEDEEGSEF